jgi:hypothetical protein
MTARITNPTTTSGHSGGASGAASGAARGAAVGSVAGPVGMAVGAVIGAAAGWISGSGNDKADYHRKMADLYRRKGLDLQAAAARRDMIRKFRMQRAMGLIGATMEEGGSRSSAPQGGLASLNAQFAGADSYMEAGIYLGRQADKHTRKGAKAAANASQNQAIMDSAMQAASSFGSSGMFSSVKGISSSQASTAFGQIPSFNPSIPYAGSTTYTPSFGTPTYNGNIPSVG